MTPETAPDSTPVAADPADPVTAESAADDVPAGTEAKAKGADAARPQTTALYARRSRTPALGLWVLIAIAVGALIGVIAALATQTFWIAGIAYFAAIGALFIGMPLAAIAALVDARRNRSAPARSSRR